jgi:hypothetical protein
VRLGEGEGARAGLVALAVETVIEGCVGETLAAALARVAAVEARSPAVRDLLEKIGEDEARHAALAWKIVGWAIEEGGAAVKAAVKEALAAAMARPPQARAVPSDMFLEGEEASWRAWGRLSAAAEAATIRETMRAVIGPCAAALLAERAWLGGDQYAAGSSASASALASASASSWASTV